MDFLVSCTCVIGARCSNHVRELSTSPNILCRCESIPYFVQRLYMLPLSLLVLLEVRGSRTTIHNISCLTIVVLLSQAIEFGQPGA